MKNLPSTNSLSNVVWIEDAAQPAAQCNAYPGSGQAEFTIGELAREFGVTLRALRFYENKGFITPRRIRNVRLYSQSDRARVAAILAGKKLGFTLAEISTMLAGKDGDAHSLKVTKEKCLEQIHMLEKQQLNIKEALAELWRIHAGLSAEIIRVDFKEAGSDGNIHQNPAIGLRYSEN
jgi:DNA-binding transcriptional MerR regulator